VSQKPVHKLLGYTCFKAHLQGAIQMTVKAVPREKSSPKRITGLMKTISIKNPRSTCLYKNCKSQNFKQTGLPKSTLAALFGLLFTFAEKSQ